MHQKNIVMLEDNGGIVTTIIASLATLIAALGLPHFYRQYFGHLSAKRKAEAENEKKIQELNLKISQIVTSVDMLLIVIKDEFEDSPNIQTAIARVEQHLHQIKEDTDDKQV